ncbi:DUF2812 domain-containing protein [Nesterenkonia halotolerans]|uniref:DUF2812 domain-containing protein n=1 Tax=Nesterenkonia halotolerans TaxID=225325 RepID=UPI003EE622F1
MTVKRLKFFANFDKEEAWLNQMAARGYLLTSAGLFYRFGSMPPGSAVVRVDYRPTMNRSDFEDYLRLFEDSGWQHLSGSRNSGPQYFASFSEDPEAEIFSDKESKAQRYRRSVAAWGVVLLPLLTVVFALANQGAIGLSALASPKDWYLTPGLWDMQGIDFLGSFILETPITLFRTGGPFLLVGFCLYLIALIVHQCLLYQRARGR